MEYVCYEEQMPNDSDGVRADPRVVYTLREDHADFEGADLIYHLCELRFAEPSQYFIEVILDKERAAAYIGDNASAAKAFYAALVKGGVTPCTLLDIVQDAFG